MGCSSSKEMKAPVKKSKHYPALLASVPSQAGKIVAITGCTSGTGLVGACAMASKGAHVFLLNRASDRAKAALEKVQEAAGAQGHVPTHVDCDLQDFASVREAAAAVLGHEAVQQKGIDVLCNNAGVMALADTATKDGYDVQMQTNHLSHFLLTARLLPALERAAENTGEARVVNHSSVARLGKPFDVKYTGKNGGNLGGDKAGMMMNGPRWERYHQTKLANGIFTYALLDKCSEAGGTSAKIKSLVAHPGFASTNLQVTTVKEGGMGAFSTKMWMKTGTCQSPEDGTCGILTCMALPDVKTGQFYGPGAGVTAFTGKAVIIKPEDIMTDDKAKEALWASSVEAVGEDFAFGSASK